MRGANIPERISETAASSSQSASMLKGGRKGISAPVIVGPLAEIPPWKPPEQQIKKVSEGISKNSPDTRSERLPRIGEKEKLAPESMSGAHDVHLLSGRASTNSLRRYRTRTVSLPKPPPSPFAPYAHADFSVPMPRVIQEVRLSTERLGLVRMDQGAASQQRTAVIGKINSKENLIPASSPKPMPPGGPGPGVFRPPNAAPIGSHAKISAAPGSPPPPSQPTPDRSSGSKPEVLEAAAETAAASAAVVATNSLAPSSSSKDTGVATTFATTAPPDEVLVSTAQQHPDGTKAPLPSTTPPHAPPKAKGGVFSSLLCCMGGSKAGKAG